MPPFQPTPWTEIEDAIHFWFAESTGLRVIWDDQKAPQPDWPYGRLNKTVDGVKIGQDGVRYENDGDQLVTTFCGLREFTVSCQIDLGPIGECSSIDAGAVMSSAQMALSMPTFQERFRSVNVAVASDNEPINQFDIVVGDVWNSRAAMDVVFRTAANVTEHDSGYFDKVEVSSDISGIDPTLNLDDELIGG
jgi:hypothetical protein